MTVRKLSLSLTPELAAALDRLAAARDEDRSRLVETLLREHPLVAEVVVAARQERAHPAGPRHAPPLEHAAAGRHTGTGPHPAPPDPSWEAVGRRKRIRVSGPPPTHPRSPTPLNRPG